MFKLLWLTLIAVPLALGVPGRGAARGIRPNSTKVIGLVTAVGPAQVTILGGDGREVTVATEEDFTQKVAVGSKVTAWYSVRDGANVLDWMEYPRENFFVPAEQIRARISKVIILPISEVPDADGLFEAMADYLESSFDWYVAPRVLAEEIRDRALKPRPAATDAGLPRSTLDAIDPSTGEFDLSRYSQAEGEAGRPSQTQPQPARDTPKSTPRPASTLDAIDPSTGEFDMARYSQAPAQTTAPAATANRTRVPSRPQDQATAEQRLIRTLASKARVDAVLEADVVEAQAKLNRLVASWDGVEEPIAGKGSQTIAKLAVISPRSVVPATTVVLKLWDSHGNLLWTNQSGFAALAVREGMRSKVRKRPLSEVLRNRTGVNRWLAAVFSSLRSAPDSASLPSRR
jgi:hypothetical protein